MLPFKHFLSLPHKFKDRKKSVDKLRPRILNINIDSEGRLYVKGASSDYTQQVLFLETTITPETKIQLNCTCPSFNFEFAHLLYDQNTLLEPENFKKAIRSSPDVKSTHFVVTACKHCIAFCQYIYKNERFIKNKIRNLS